MLTRFHIAIALLYTPELSFCPRFRHFHGIPIVLYCIFVILGRVSDAIGLKTRLRHQDDDTVDVGVFDAGFFVMGGAEVAALAPGVDSQRRQRFMAAPGVAVPPVVNVQAVTTPITRRLHFQGLFCDF